jgi:hypothetical protein
MSLSVFLPNASVTVLRTPFSTQDADGYGAPVDDETAVPGMADVPVSLRSKQTRAWDPEQQRYLSVTTYVVRFRPGSDVRQYDRIKDAAGGYYAVANVTSNRSAIGGATDVVATATAVQ